MIWNSMQSMLSTELLNNIDQEKFHFILLVQSKLNIRRSELPLAELNIYQHISKSSADI